MTNSFLVLDIETVRDPELPVQLTDAACLPSPPYHQIVALGVLLFDAAYEVKRIEVIGELEGEAGILEDFARLLEEQRTRAASKKYATTAGATWHKRPACFSECSWCEAKLIANGTSRRCVA